MLFQFAGAVKSIFTAITKVANVVERGASTAHHALGPLEAQAIRHSEQAYLSAARDLRRTLEEAGVNATSEAVEIYLRDGDMSLLRKQMALPPKPGDVIESTAQEKSDG